MCHGMALSLSLFRTSVFHKVGVQRVVPTTIQTEINTSRIPWRRAGSNTVSESMVSNAKLSEFLALTEFRGESSMSSSQPITVCANTNSRSFSQNSPCLPENSISLLFQNPILDTLFRPFSNSRRFFDVQVLALNLTYLTKTFFTYITVCVFVSVVRNIHEKEARHIYII